MDIQKLTTKFVIFFLLLINAQVHAQDDPTPKVIPPYPTTSSLGNFGNIPIGLDTGRPNINLEVYTLRGRELTIPVSLNYTSNGVQVDAIPTQLGLEWNLIAGGVISRSVNGEGDFDIAHAIPSNVSGVCSNSLDSEALYHSQGSTQVDVFSYSALGISGKFVLTSNGILEIGPTKNKIELLTTTDESSIFHRYFKITDVSGTVYIFGGNTESEEISRYKNWCANPPEPQTPFQTGWYLTKVSTIKGEEANFSYTRENYFYTSGYSQQGAQTSNGGILISGPAGIGVPCKSTVSHTAVFLSAITIDDKSLVFNYDTLDTVQEDSKQLVGMEVYSGITQLLRTFTFDYYLFSRNNSSDVLNTHTIGTDDLNKKLIFLKSIDEHPTVSSVPAYIEKYLFDYYSPEQLPPRFSFSKDIYGFYNAADNNDMLYNNLTPSDPLYTSFIGTANREPNPLTVYFGMLKTITYPTGGKTGLVYEPNSIYTDKIIYPPTVTKQAGYEASGSLFTNVVYTEEFPILFNQEASLFAWSEFLPVEGEPCTYAESHGASCKVEVINVATGAVVKSITAQPELNDTVSLLSGVTYKLKISSVGSCINTYGSITYRDLAPYTIKVNEPVAGVRVAETRDYDDNGSITTKKYSYGDLDCLDCSSGHFLTENPKATRNIDTFRSGAYGDMVKWTMFSSPKVPLNSFNGNVLSYSTVVEDFGGDFERGGTLHVYDNNMDEPTYLICEEYVRGTSYSNGNYNHETNTLSFKKEGTGYTKVTEEEFEYDSNPVLDFAIDCYTGRLYMAATAPFGVIDYYYAFDNYQIRGAWHYLKSKTSKVYDLNGLNPIINTSRFYYDNPHHLQLTRQEIQDSEGILIVNKNYYPDDLNSEPLMADLKTANRIGEMVLTEIYKGGNKISAKRNSYIQNADSSGLLLKGSNYNAVFPNSAATIPNIGQMSKILTFNKYDSYGNILQFTSTDGISVMFIWGYHDTYPIAKIEGSDYATLTSTQLNLIASAKSASDIDIDQASESILKIKLDALRNGFPDAMVTTLTYDPLVGITSATDPKNAITTYDYDSFGRLKTVKDNQGSIVKENAYHFKTSN